jgi:hypothetical protein
MVVRAKRAAVAAKFVGLLAKKKSQKMQRDYGVYVPERSEASPSPAHNLDAEIVVPSATVTAPPQVSDVSPQPQQSTPSNGSGNWTPDESNSVPVAQSNMACPSSAYGESQQYQQETTATNQSSTSAPPTSQQVDEYGYEENGYDDADVNAEGVGGVTGLLGSLTDSINQMNANTRSMENQWYQLQRALKTMMNNVQGVTKALNSCNS